MSTPRVEQLQIRSGTEADIDGIIRISNAIWRDSLAAVLGVDLEDWRLVAGALHGELIPIVRTMSLATLKSQVVGFAYRNGAMIDDLWIDPPHQRKGIGSRLLRTEVAAVAADGYRTASLDCLEANAQGRRFYEREGWRPAYRYSRPSPLFHRDIPRIRFEYDVWRLERA